MRKRGKAVQVCARVDCPDLTDPGETYCDAHRRETSRAKDARRGSFRERGYDATYDRNRERVLREETHCARCGEVVDKSLRHPHPQSATVGHVVARSDGGSNDRTNLRLEHRRCNAKAGRG